MEAVFWLVLLIILLGIEIITVGLTTIWFAGGALVALAVYGLGFDLGWQVAVFVVVSVVLLVFTRPLAVKYINVNKLKTNYEGVIGKVVRLTENVNNLNGTGTALINGVEWTARSTSDEINIPAGTIVKVVDIKGVKVIVEENKE
jgi:membrane protein implicated in regulation of membrane protease activity